jgi:hypothetical protein
MQSARFHVLGQTSDTQVFRSLSLYHAVDVVRVRRGSIQTDTPFSGHNPREYYAALDYEHDVLSAHGAFDVVWIHSCVVASHGA